MLRKLTAVVLILTLTSQCFYKLACVTYYQLNKDYIAEFLCVNRDNPITMCYGQCFLIKALEFESDSTTNSIATNFKFELPIFKTDEFISIHLRPLFNKPFFSEYQFSQGESFYQSIFHPPLTV